MTAIQSNMIKTFEYHIPKESATGVPTIKGVVSLTSGSSGLNIVMSVNDLFLRSSNDTDSANFYKVMGDSEVMKTFGNGITRTAEQCKERAMHYSTLWKKGIPWSVLMVFDKIHQFTGIIFLTGNEPGKVEIGGMVVKEKWGQQIGTIIGPALAKGLMPVLMKESYKLNGEIPNELVASALVTNRASRRVLEKCGMKYKETYIRKEIGPDVRVKYSLDLTPFCKHIQFRSLRYALRARL